MRSSGLAFRLLLVFGGGALGTRARYLLGVASRPPRRGWRGLGTGGPLGAGGGRRWAGAGASVVDPLYAWLIWFVLGQVVAGIALAGAGMALGLRLWPAKDAS